jgi:hypothetical protein
MERMSGGGIIKVDAGGGGTAITYSEPYVDNISIVAANTWQPYALLTGAKSFELKTRGGSHIKLAFSPSPVDYITIKGKYDMQAIAPDAGITLYLSCAQAGDVIEIIQWL